MKIFDEFASSEYWKMVRRTGSWGEILKWSGVVFAAAIHRYEALLIWCQDLLVGV
jgi:hypothetical protein